MAATYLSGKMFAHAASVRFSDALAHEIVPLSTLASPKPKSSAHISPGEVAFLHAFICARARLLHQAAFVVVLLSVCWWVWGLGASAGHKLGFIHPTLTVKSGRCSNYRMLRELQQNDRQVLYTKIRSQSGEKTDSSGFWMKRGVYAHLYRGMSGLVCFHCGLFWLMNWLIPC